MCRSTYWEPGWLVETVKRPGTTTLPGLGDLLTVALDAAGVPPLGGGGAGNATGSGHTNLQYNEVHVYTFPQLLGGPCTGCAPGAAPFTLHYASETDPLWRTAVATPSPLSVLQQIGVWAPLYPRGGKAIHSSEPVGSGIAAVRGMDIAHQPVGTPPNADAHVVLQPTASTSRCCQLAQPAADALLSRRHAPAAVGARDGQPAGHLCLAVLAQAVLLCPARTGLVRYYPCRNPWSEWMSASHTTHTLAALMLWTSLTAPGWAQDVRLLDCAQVQFFGPACVPVTPLPPAPPPPTPPPAPLFSPETMAPDTPPLLLKVLEEPTVEHAQAFLAWQQRRAARLAEVQQLLRRLTAPTGQP